MEDLCYGRRLIEPVIPWEQFLVTYQERWRYRLPSEEDATFYDIWSQVRNATCCAVSWYGFLNNAYPATKDGLSGYSPLSPDLSNKSA